MADIQTEHKKCPECVSTERPNAKYCSECGYWFNKPDDNEQPTKMDLVLRFLLRLLTVSTLFRIITAIGLFFAITRQSRNYFFFLRLAVCFTSVYLIYVAIATKNYAWITPFIVFLMLFNPIYAPDIVRQTWQIVDMGCGVLFILSIFFLGEKMKKS